MHPWGRCVRSGSSGSSVCARGVAGFFQVRLVRSGMPRGSLGSFGFIWIVRMRHVGRWVRFHASGTSECVLVVAGYVWVRLFRAGAP